MSSYDEWLDNADLEDTEEAKEWYECPDEDRAEWLEHHPDF